MIEEFNLSKKRIRDFDDFKFMERDIKTFIRLLKEELLKSNFETIKIIEVIKIINKLSGNHTHAIGEEKKQK